jgi:hypothetical protein
MFYPNFQNIPSVKRWAEKYSRKLVGKKKIKARLRALWYMCNHLKLHPMKCTPEQISKVIVEMRDKTFRGEQPPKGLSYYSQREAWRGYFKMIRGVPVDVMTDLGVDAMASHGSGKHSKQRLTQAQREQFRQGLLELCGNPKNHFNYNHYLEGLAAAKFMYYTGARAGGRLDRELGSVLGEEEFHALADLHGSIPDGGGTVGTRSRSGIEEPTKLRNGGRTRLLSVSRVNQETGR